jgi:hypothetical protein
MGMQIVQVRCGPSTDVCNAHGLVCLLLWCCSLPWARGERQGDSGNQGRYWEDKHGIGKAWASNSMAGGEILERT